MADVRLARRALVARILGGSGDTSPAERLAAFNNAGLPEGLRALIGKVAQHADQVTDADVAAVRASGLTEDQIFELVVCAAIGQANRQYDAALAALENATRGNDAARDPR
jgi:alkylhydroperoxidase family enzyme